MLYTWIGGTRRDWRGQGHFRALTEQQEVWAVEQGFDEIVVKTKNRFYEMRGTLDHLRFEVVKYERNAGDNAESKVYLSKKLHSEVLGTHRSAKTVVQATYVGLEDAGLAVLAHAVPRKAAAVHRDVDAGRKHLREAERAAQVEQPVRAAEGVRHHRAGEDDGLRERRAEGPRPGLRAVSTIVSVPCVITSLASAA